MLLHSKIPAFPPKCTRYNAAASGLFNFSATCGKKPPFSHSHQPQNKTSFTLPIMKTAATTQCLHINFSQRSQPVSPGGADFDNGPECFLFFFLCTLPLLQPGGNWLFKADASVFCERRHVSGSSPEKRNHRRTRERDVFGFLPRPPPRTPSSSSNPGN